MWTRLELLKKCLILQAESNKEKEQIIPDLHLLLEEIQVAYGFNLTIVEQENGNLYITKGESTLYPCLVAHSDDVAKYNPNKALIHIEGADWIKACDKTTGDPHDAGGDDKCGIWAIMQALIDLPAIKGFIPIAEEIGVQGSKVADLEFFKDCMFISQFDRKGKSDFIDYTNGTQVSSKEFKDYVEPIMKDFGFSFANGTLTDIGELFKRGVGVCCHNLSSGYYNAHSNTSYVKPSELFNSYDFWLEIVKNCDKQFIFEYKAPVYNYNYNSNNKNSYTLKQISDKLHDRYMKEHKSGKHTTIAMSDWFVKLLDKMDTKNKWVLHYSETTDYLSEHLDDLEETEIEKANWKKVNGLKQKCKNPKTCQEPKQTDLYAMGGPIDICTTCKAEVPTTSQNKIDFKGGGNFGPTGWSEYSGSEYYGG